MCAYIPWFRNAQRPLDWNDWKNNTHLTMGVCTRKQRGQTHKHNVYLLLDGTSKMLWNNRNHMPHTCSKSKGAFGYDLQFMDNDSVMFCCARKRFIWFAETLNPNQRVAIKLSNNFTHQVFVRKNKRVYTRRKCIFFGNCWHIIYSKLRREVWEREKLVANRVICLTFVA